MTTSSTATLHISAIPAETLRRIRERGVDDLGNQMVEHRYDEGGYPLRCCLRDSEPGEPIAAIGYNPFPWRGPYAETGPVYVHTGPCPGYTDTASYPEGFRHRRQIFRAYGPEHSIVDAVIVEGSRAEQALADLFGRPEVEFVHSRNIAYGCYMFMIERSPSATVGP